MKRQAVTITLTFTVDADGAKLLPGWPGFTDCYDRSTPPQTGLQMTIEDAAHKAVGFIEDQLPTVVDARWIAATLDIGPEFDATPTPQ